MTHIPHLEEAMAELRKLHPHGSFSVGWTYPHGPMANVHMNGVCYNGGNRAGRSASKAFLDALVQVPDPALAIRARVERARAELKSAEEAALGLLGDVAL